MKTQLIVSLSVILFSANVMAQSVAIDVTLNPAGSFQAKTSKVTGAAARTADGGVVAENVVVDANSLATGIELRDKHTRKYMEADKYPTVKIIKATGKNGKGEALLEIKGKQHKVLGTYTIEGNSLKGKFRLHLADVNITNVKYMGIGVADDVQVNFVLPLGTMKTAAR